MRISNDHKQSILLPRDYHVIFLIIRIHHNTLHVGISTVSNYMRMRYWIRLVIRNELHRCHIYAKCSSQRNQQLMGDLPSLSPPYANVFIRRMSMGRVSNILKRYVCAFVCLVTKAVHLELVSDLSPRHFLLRSDDLLQDVACVSSSRAFSRHSAFKTTNFGYFLFRF